MRVVLQWNSEMLVREARGYGTALRGGGERRPEDVKDELGGNLPRRTGSEVVVLGDCGRVCLVSAECGVESMVTVLILKQI